MKLKRCTACKMVRYCSRVCQVAHRPQHKKACKKRAVELFDEELFKDAPEREECPICMLPLPFDRRQLVFVSCCGKTICSGCVHAQRKEDIRNNGKGLETCAFCRAPVPNTEKEIIDLLKRGVERNDMASIEKLAECIRDGKSGLEKDFAKVMELFLKAGKLGSADAYYMAGDLYRDRNGVEKDIEKARHFYELGTIGGSIKARHNFANFELLAGRDEQALRHFLICAKAGYEFSLVEVKNGFKSGHITKDEYAEALRIFQIHDDETKSALRDEALVYQANPSLYFENSG